MEAAAHHDMQQPYCSPSSSPDKSCNQECSCFCKDCSESSTTSTPYVSAPSSPSRRCTTLGYYLATSALTTSASSEAPDINDAVDFVDSEAKSTLPFSPAAPEFDFSARFSEANSWLSPSIASTMSSAEELFYNGKIRPLNLSSYCICFDGAANIDSYYSLSAANPHVPNACCCRGGEYLSPHAGHSYQNHQQPVRKQILDSTKSASALSALDQWKKGMGKYAHTHEKYDKGHPHAHAHAHAHAHRKYDKGDAHHAERGTLQISNLPLACYNNGEGGHHRRSRSLSPLRVFHMDDMIQPRVSFDSKIYTDVISSPSAALDDAVGIVRPRRSRKSWTLKELLYMGDNKVHDRRGKFINSEASSLHDEDSTNEDNQLGCADPGARSGENGIVVRKLEEKRRSKCAGDNMGRRSLVEERKHIKSSTQARSPWMQQKVMLGHTEQYYNGSQRANAEEMKKRTFLPYKKGLLGCLGITSKLSSMKGLHAKNSDLR